ncbi:MAG: hypothetical protein LGR52_05845 [Candidatus Thiosymbion ectosymbiont of Robbea hypermnestra]|nr:hypothetical protein [Candidatus Thiosymbion ectosymbiont of Robbea hypermnestra]
MIALRQTRRYHIGCLLLLALAISAARADPAERHDAPPTFERLLAESGMALLVSDGFVPVAVRPNARFLYDRAYASPDGTLEIRYAVRPLGRIRIDYEDPHSAAPDPNHMFPLMFQSMVASLSAGRHSPTREYPPKQAREKFNADWAAAAVFDTDAGFAPNHRQALVVAMHKDALADAYAIFLFDEYGPVRQRVDANLGSLRFAP